MNESATPNEQCLALNSLITQCLIQTKSMNDIEKETFVDIMNVSEILEAIKAYLVDNDTKKLRTTFFEVRSIFKNLFINKID